MPGFDVDASGKLRCKLCLEYYGISEKWMSSKSHSGHISSQRHRASIEAEKIHIQTLANIQAQNAATTTNLERQFASLHDVQPEFPSLHFTEQSRGPGFLEAPFGDLFNELMGDIEDATFSTGEDNSSHVFRTLQQELDNFGLWNESNVARKLGFGSQSIPPELITSEDDTLTNVMQEMSMFSLPSY